MSDQIMVYIVMPFFWMAQVVKYLHSHPVLLAPTIRKSTLIFRRWNKLTHDFVPRFCRLENCSLSRFRSCLMASLEKNQDQSNNYSTKHRKDCL